MMLAAAIACASRSLLVCLFLPFSALDKVLNRGAAVDQASTAVPDRRIAALMVAGGFCIEVLMSLGVLTGVADRLAALILAGYCLITAVLWKQFWAIPDFRLRGANKGREVFWDFLKNLALTGGLIVVAFGSDGSGLESFLHHPLSSSHPYASAELISR